MSTETSYHPAGLPAAATRYRPRNKDFEFTKLMKCRNCCSSITAQEKFKKIAGQEKTEKLRLLPLRPTFG